MSAMRIGNTIPAADNSGSSDSNSTTNMAELVRQMADDAAAAASTAAMTKATTNNKGSKEQPSNNKENNSAPEVAIITRESTNAVVKALIADTATTEEMKPLMETNFSDATFNKTDIDSDGDPTGVFDIPWNEIQTNDGLQPTARRFNMKGGGLMRKTELVEATREASKSRVLCEGEEPAANIHEGNEEPQEEAPHLQAVEHTLF